MGGLQVLDTVDGITDRDSNKSAVRRDPYLRSGILFDRSNEFFVRIEDLLGTGHIPFGSAPDARELTSALANGLSRIV